MTNDDPKSSNAVPPLGAVKDASLVGSGTTIPASNDGQEPIGQVRIEIEGPIGWVVFDHQSRRNAMTKAMWLQVPGLCHDLDDNTDVRVVVLRGAGERAFVAGADISQFTDERTPEKADAYNDATAAAYSAIENINKPVIAMIHGFCIGGGLALALAADIRYAADDAKFALPPAKLGIGYGADGIGVLVDLLGPSRTKELIYTADLLDSSQALHWGLANQVIAKDQLCDFVEAQCKTIASRAPLSQAAAKLAVAEHLDPGKIVPSHFVTHAIDRCMNSQDYAEGVAAFLEKRKPEFRGI